MLIFFQIFSLSSISTKSIKSKVNLTVAATFTIKFQTIFIYLNSILFNFVLLSLSKDKRSSLSLSISYLHRHCIFLHVSFSRLHPVALSLSMHSCRTSRVVGVKHFFRPLGYEGVHFHFPFIALSLSRMLIYDMFVSFFCELSNFFYDFTFWFSIFFSYACDKLLKPQSLGCLVNENLNSSLTSKLLTLDENLKSLNNFENKNH